MNYPKKTFGKRKRRILALYLWTFKKIHSSFMCNTDLQKHSEIAP